MVYSKNKEIIAAVEPYLKVIKESDGQSLLSWKTTNVNKFQYLLHNAFKLCEEDKDSPYKELKSKWRIKKRHNLVIVEPKDSGISALKVEKHIEVDKVVLSDLRTLIEIVGAAVEHKHRDNVLFPDAQLQENDLAKLHIWAKANNFYIVVTAEGTLLTKEQHELAYVKKEEA